MNTLTLKETILNHFLQQKVKGKYKLPEVGTYYPSSLTSSCLKEQWNYYMIPRILKRWSDDFILRTSEGTIWHNVLESLPHQWEQVEIPVRRKIKLLDKSVITIRGRADAFVGDTVFEFKKTGFIPAKPRFAHLLQLNWYMEVMGKPKGTLVYIGTRDKKFDIVEFPWTLSDFYTATFINRAIGLHGFLIHKDEPFCSCRNKHHDIEWLRCQEEAKRGHK